MQVIHSALREPLVTQITWKCTQEFRSVWPLDLWAFWHSGQALLKICTPDRIFSHTLKLIVTSACFFIPFVVLNVLYCCWACTFGGGKRDIQSRLQLYFTAGFICAVCLLFIQAMLVYLHDNALLKVLLDGTESFLFVQWFEPFTVVHWPEAKILLPVLCQQLPLTPRQYKSPGSCLWLCLSGDRA